MKYSCLINSFLIVLVSSTVTPVHGIRQAKKAPTPISLLLQWSTSDIRRECAKTYLSRRSKHESNLFNFRSKRQAFAETLSMWVPNLSLRPKPTPRYCTGSRKSNRYSEILISSLRKSARRAWRGKAFVMLGFYSSYFPPFFSGNFVVVIMASTTRGRSFNM